MQKNVRVKLNLRGLNKLMSGNEAKREVNAAAYRLAARAGTGHEVVPAEARKHPWVARSYVQQADDAQAKRDPDGFDLLRAIND